MVEALALSEMSKRDTHVGSCGRLAKLLWSMQPQTDLAKLANEHIVMCFDCTAMAPTSRLDTGIEWLMS